ncbi:MAG: helix-turn-helix domain-containing protein [Tannerellaceae bacterium]|jgi:transcriptional regulator with XRE-family HTH domain|nr:helix-turn-helix domain-containing protein [Tannerellaceae bacterium]
MTARELIIKTRKAKRLTQAVLAEKAGITTPTVSRYESGKSDLGVANLEKIMDALGINFSNPEREEYEKIRDGEAERVAKILVEKGLFCPCRLTKGDMFALTGSAYIQQLDDTFDYFKSLVSFHMSKVKNKEYAIF